MPCEQKQLKILKKLCLKTKQNTEIRTFRKRILLSWRARNGRGMLVAAGSKIDFDKVEASRNTGDEKLVP